MKRNYYVKYGKKGIIMLNMVNFILGIVFNRL